MVNLMDRMDKELAFLLRYENIAWYENGEVRILDRRVYPREISFVVCKHHDEVRQALKDMVTQSAGPYSAAKMGVALAAYESKHLSKEEQIAYMRDAANTIAHARPTTIDRMKRVCNVALDVGVKAIEKGEDPCEAIVKDSIEKNNIRYKKIEKIAEYLVDLFPEKGRVMTQCYGETIVGMMCKVARQRQLDIEFYVPETRPYFQGAKLTASVIHEMGFKTTLITDNMVALVMQTKQIDLFTSAADVICLDGHVCNKIGTFQYAIVANHFGIPYFTTGGPDSGHPTVDTVEIEYRDPDYVLQAMGVKTAMDGVSGFYPSFDITPPHLISGIITDQGIFSPFNLQKYFEHSDGSIVV